MIDPAQIPDEVVEAAAIAYDKAGSDISYEGAIALAIASALAAWPDASTADWGDHGEEFLILPLPQETSDG